MIDALRGSAVGKFVIDPFSYPGAENWRHPLRELGCSIAGLLTSNWNVKPSAHNTAAKQAMDRWGAPTLALDCVLSAAHRPDTESFDCDSLVVKEGIADCIDFEQSTVSNLELQWCQIKTVNIGEFHPQKIRLYQSLIDRLVGVSDADGLPDWIVECEIGGI